MGMDRTTAERNANTFISRAANGGRDAWWSDGINNTNHYDGFIPFDDIQDKLLFDVEQVPMSVDVPVEDYEQATGMDDDGNPIRKVDVPDKCAIVRTDTFEVIGVNGGDYRIHNYRDIADDIVHRLTGETLGIVSAGLLRNGSQFWIQVAHEMTTHDNMTGIDFRSFILANTSLDGSLATGVNVATTLAACENTFSVARREGGNRRYRRKHSKHSEFDIADVAQALDIVAEKDDEFVTFAQDMCKWEITDKELFLFLDQWSPLPDEFENQKGYTRSSNRRDAFVEMYRRDPMCADWQDTAFGLLQTANTFEHYSREVRGGSRANRIQENIVSGKMAASDESAYKMLLVATA